MRVAIVGGGLGGLAAALFLRQAGIEATVFEQSPELRDVGAGIVVSPNMVRPLARLGLAERLPAFAVRLEAAWEFRRWRDGRILSTQPMGDECERLYGAACYVAHRGDLLMMFRDALPAHQLVLDRRLVSIRQSSSEIELVLEDAAGHRTEASADVAIGADGIRSTLRKMIAPGVEARFSGLAAFRCLVPAEHAPEMSLRPVQTLWLGPGRHFVHYPISGGQLVNVVAIAPAGDWRSESWTAEGEIPDALAEFEGWDPRVRQLLASAASTRRWAMYDRDPLERWTEGRVTLLGDAAHAMLPFFAQGAAQAVEDALVLAGCLQDASAATAPQALERYERIRRPRTTEVQLMSRGREIRNHLPDGPEQEKRDAELAAGAPLRQSAWLYGRELEADLRRDP